MKKISLFIAGTLLFAIPFVIPSSFLVNGALAATNCDGYSYDEARVDNYFQLIFEQTTDAAERAQISKLRFADKEALKVWYKACDQANKNNTQVPQYPKLNMNSRDSENQEDGAVPAMPSPVPVQPVVPPVKPADDATLQTPSAGDTVTEVDDALFFMDKVTPKELSAEKLKTLVEKYREVIPKGVYGYGELPLRYRMFGMTPGQVNNLVYGSNDTACGGYQGSVLKLLLSLKFSPDKNISGLLDEYDFGPIQIEKGGHQAVVIFPKGSDWRLGGVVLDPWIEQTPKIYNIEKWQKKFMLGTSLLTIPEGSVGNILTPISTNTGYFPTTPGPDGEWGYKDIFSDKVELSDKYRRLREERATAEKLKQKTVNVGSPVAVLVTSADGKRVGLTADGTFVNDFGANVDAYIFEKPDGTYSSTFTLPKDVDYKVALAATGSGEVHVSTHEVTKDIIVFDPVIVTKGENLNLTWNKIEANTVLTGPKGETIKSESLSVEEAATGTTNYTSMAIVALVILILGALYFWKIKK